MEIIRPNAPPLADDDLAYSATLKTTIEKALENGSRSTAHSVAQSR